MAARTRLYLGSSGRSNRGPTDLLPLDESGGQQHGTSAASPGSEAALKAPHSKSGHGSVVPMDDEERPAGAPPSPPVELDEEKGEPVPVPAAVASPVDETSSSAD